MFRRTARGSGLVPNVGGPHDEFGYGIGTNKLPGESGDRSKSPSGPAKRS